MKTLCFKKLKYLCKGTEADLFCCFRVIHKLLSEPFSHQQEAVSQNKASLAGLRV